MLYFKENTMKYGIILALKLGKESDYAFTAYTKERN